MTRKTDTATGSRAWQAVARAAAERARCHPSIVALDAAAERHDFQHEDRRIRWRRFGTGSPLVMLHGGHGCWLHWQRNVEALSARHAVWVPDMPSFGESDDLPGPPHAPDRMTRLVASLDATIGQAIGRDTRFDLVGFSFGGIAAALLAAAASDRVNRLALLGPGGHGGTRRQTVDLIEWRRADPEAMREALAHNLTAFMLHEVHALDDLALAIHTVACVHTRFRSKQISRAGGLQAALDSWAGPTLLVWGEHDVTAAPRELGPQLVAGRPERQWREIAAAGHWVQYERADETNQLMLDWLA